MKMPISYNATNEDVKFVSRFYKKFRHKFFPSAFNVVFTVKCRDGLSSGHYYNELFATFSDLINRHGLTRIIKVLDLKNVFDFKNSDEAEKFRNQNNADLVIWGRFTEDGLKKEGGSFHELRLNYTFPCIDDKDGIIKDLIKFEFEHVLARNSFYKILENSSYEDVQFIADNVFNEASYILGKALLIFQRFEESEQVFLSLLEKTKNDEVLSNAIRFNLNCIYDVLFLNSYYDRKKIKITKGVVDRARLLFVDDIAWLGRNAFTHYKLGDYNEARKIVEQLYTLYPNHALAIIDRAFFLILDKKYKKAYFEYKRLEKHNIVFNVLEVTESLREEYFKTKESMFLYSSGMLNMKYADKKIGRDDLVKFLEIAVGDQYKKMYRDAKRLINI